MHKFYYEWGSLLVKKKHTWIKWSNSVSHEDWEWYRSPFVNRLGNWEFIILMLPFCSKDQYLLFSVYHSAIFEGSVLSDYSSETVWAEIPLSLLNTWVCQKPATGLLNTLCPTWNSTTEKKTSWQSSLYVSFSLACSCWFSHNDHQDGGSVTERNTSH